MRDRLHLTFAPENIAAPIVCEVAKKFDVTFSIRRADVTPEAGWMHVELSGEDDEISRAIEYLQQKGVRVDPIEGDIIAG